MADRAIRAMCLILAPSIGPHVAHASRFRFDFSQPDCCSSSCRLRDSRFRLKFRQPHGRVQRLPRASSVVVSPGQHAALPLSSLDRRWRMECNTIRPHSSLGYCPPAPKRFSHGPDSPRRILPNEKFIVPAHTACDAVSNGVVPTHDRPFSRKSCPGPARSAHILRSDDAWPG